MRGRGTCVAGGHAWKGDMRGRGACVAGGMHGRGHAWQGACMAGGMGEACMAGETGACIAGGMCGGGVRIRGACVAADGTHPPGMHSSCEIISHGNHFVVTYLFVLPSNCVNCVKL